MIRLCARSSTHMCWFLYTKSRSSFTFIWAAWFVLYLFTIGMFIFLFASQHSTAQRHTKPNEAAENATHDRKRFIFETKESGKRERDTHTYKKAAIMIETHLFLYIESCSWIKSASASGNFGQAIHVPKQYTAIKKKTELKKKNHSRLHNMTKKRDEQRTHNVHPDYNIDWSRNSVHRSTVRATCYFWCEYTVRRRCDRLFYFCSDLKSTHVSALVIERKVHQPNLIRQYCQYLQWNLAQHILHTIWFILKLFVKLSDFIQNWPAYCESPGRRMTTFYTSFFFLGLETTPRWFT